MPVTVHDNKESEAREFLRTHRVGVLATVDPNGEPYAAAVYFSVDDASNVSFITKTGTKKADNLEHKNHAMLVVYDASSQTTVQVVGTVSEVSDKDEIDQLVNNIVYASIQATGQALPPIAKLDEGGYIAYRLEPSQVRMAVFSAPKTGSYKELFETIVPGKK